MTSLSIAPPDRAETEVVADLVERYLSNHQPSTYRLVVRRNAIRRGANRWLVEIGTEANGHEVRADDFADRLVAANLFLDRDFPRYVRLTSIVPQAGEVL